MSVLHGDEDSFLEKVLVDEAAVSLGHQHSEIQSKENLVGIRELHLLHSIKSQVRKQEELIKTDHFDDDNSIQWKKSEGTDSETKGLQCSQSQEIK